MTQDLTPQQYIAERLASESRYRAFPEARYIINHQYKFIYCPIPKVASTSIKRAIIALGNPPETALIHPHNYAANRLSLRLYHHQDAEKFLQDTRYWKFAWVRNPWTRAISGYISKFVHPWRKQPPTYARKVIDLVYGDRNLEPDWQKGITFRQFVAYLARTEDRLLNLHWKPQHLFLSQNYAFDFIGQFENLERDFSYVQQKLGLEMKLPWSNRKHQQVEIPEGTKRFCDYYPWELKQFPKMPLYQQFYDSELIELITARYAQDVALFDYNFT